MCRASPLSGGRIHMAWEAVSELLQTAPALRLVVSVAYRTNPSCNARKPATSHRPPASLETLVALEPGRLCMPAFLASRTPSRLPPPVLASCRPCLLQLRLALLQGPLQGSLWWPCWGRLPVARPRPPPSPPSWLELGRRGVSHPAPSLRFRAEFLHRLSFWWDCDLSSRQHLESKRRHDVASMVPETGRETHHQSTSNSPACSHWVLVAVVA
mmetsp:Transcript_18143/g.42404  ORF Transcript_18143/g.42404 Transcript_18143/m.42404 type:complete len:213 (-) Transcript_18143:668-1306(-)